MQIFTKDKCPECDGVGVLTHHAWMEFYTLEEEYKKQHGGEYDPQFDEWENVEKWFREKGYSKIPPEEPQCYECDGVGEIQKWMDIKEILELANILG